MSNSSGITPTQPGGIKPSSGGQVVPIKSLPDGLQSVSRPLHLEGEVIAQNSDGSTRLKTAEGAIDITIRGRQPQPGQKVEIDIPAGNPPRQATVRTPPSPPPQAPQTQTPASPAADPVSPLPPILTRPAEQPPVAARQAPATNTPPLQTPAPGTAEEPVPTNLPPTPQPASQAAPKPALPPLNGSYQPTQAVLQALNTPLPPLTTGQSVQMQSIPPAQAQALLQSIAAQLTRAGSQAGTASIQNFPDNLIKILNIMPAQQGGQASPLPQGAATATNSPDLSGGTNLHPPGPGNTNLLGTENIISKETGILPGPEEILKNLLLSPKLPQTEWKIITILPPPQAQTQASPQAKAQPAPPLAPSPNAAAPAITAILLGTMQTHQPVILVPWPGSGQSMQLFTLQPGAGPLPPGTEIVLQPQPSIPGQTAARPASPLPLFQPSTLWAAMDESFQTLIQTSPALAQAMAKIIPSPAQPVPLGSAAMLFVAFARLGNLNDWLGEDRIEALSKAGKSGLLSRLSSDAGIIARANADTPLGEWRSYPIPFLWQNDISRVMLHVKHDAPEKDQDGKEDTTRFIFDLDLPRMGDVQLDGLLRGQRLDLIVRTEIPVSVSMQDAMKKAYADALDGTNIFGELGFQGDMKHWVQVVKQHRNLGVSA